MIRLRKIIGISDKKGVKQKCLQKDYKFIKHDGH